MPFIAHSPEPADVTTPGRRVYHERDPDRPGTVQAGGIDNLVAVRWDDGFAFLYAADLLRPLSASPGRRAAT